MSAIKTNVSRGFTIVELLIVIVVIAILATITIVSFNGIQQRAREVQLSSDINGIKKAMELYKADQGEYVSCTSGNSECNYFPDIRSQLVPQYASTLSSYPFAYVNPGLSFDRWGMRYLKNNPPYNLSETCKFGSNMSAAWYGAAPECK